MFSTHAIRSRNRTDFAGGSGHLVGEFAPSEQPSRCSSSQISPGPRTRATSASGVEAVQRHRALLRAPRRKSRPEAELPHDPRAEKTARSMTSRAPAVCYRETGRKGREAGLTE